MVYLHTGRKRELSIDIDQTTDIIVEVFSGSCGSLSSMGCKDDGFPWSITVNAGETYYMRVYGYEEATCDFAITLNDVALPVRLSNFSGKVLSTSNQLTWSTTSEKAFRNFEIERAADSKKFNLIGKLNAANRQEGGTYIFSDNHPLNGNNYYRLKMVDVDGSIAYSGIVMLEKGNSNFSLKTGPNPAHDNLMINTIGEKIGHGRIQIFDLTGKLVMSCSIESDHSNIDISRLASGSYILQYRDDVYNVIQKISKY